MAPEFASKMSFVKSVSQEPCRTPHLQQNCEGNKSILSINGTPLSFFHFISVSASTNAATTTYNNKLARIQALHARCKYKDNEEKALEGDALLVC